MAKKKYRATNSIQGLTAKPIEIDQLIEMDEEAAKPFVATGSLVPHQDKAPEKATQVDGDGK